jgi:hypothetical protein
MFGRINKLITHSYPDEWALRTKSALMLTVHGPIGPRACPNRVSDFPGGGKIEGLVSPRGKRVDGPIKSSHK